MSLTGIIALLKSLSKLADVFRWAWKTFATKKAESQHAQNSVDIDAAINAPGVHDASDGQSRSTPPKTP